MKITLRKRPISGGDRYSLQLDFSPNIQHPKTKRNVRFFTLGLYLHAKPKTTNERKENRDTLTLAESVKSQIYSMALQGDYSFLTGNNPGSDLLQYMESECKLRIGHTAATWVTGINSLKRYTGKSSIPFSSVDRAFLEQYKAYLLGRYAQNTAFSYLTVLRTTLNQAYRDGIIKEKITDKVKGLSPERMRRKYLTPEELTALYRTRCEHATLKAAFLFSVLTGLRFSDVSSLTWANVVSDAHGHTLHYKQEKTELQQYHPIPLQAFELLGEHPGTGAGKLLFPDLKRLVYSPHGYLQEWAVTAGIKKRVTFHMARHTYAVQHLSNGTRMEVLRDMMGHTDLKTTQIYGQIVDELRRKAAENVRIEA